MFCLEWQMKDKNKGNLKICQANPVSPWSYETRSPSPIHLELTRGSINKIPHKHCFFTPLSQSLCASPLKQSASYFTWPGKNPWSFMLCTWALTPLSQRGCVLAATEKHWWFKSTRWLLAGPSPNHSQILARQDSGRSWDISSKTHRLCNYCLSLEIAQI